MIKEATRRGRLRGLASLLALALAVATIQGLMSCGARSHDTGGGTSRSERGAISLDAATRKQVITDVATTIRDNYADRAIGDTLATTLIRNLEEGRYDSVANADSLAAAVMAVIRSKVPDRHEVGLARRSGSV